MSQSRHPGATRKPPRPPPPASASSALLQPPVAEVHEALVALAQTAERLLAVVPREVSKMVTGPPAYVLLAHLHLGVERLVLPLKIMDVDSVYSGIPVRCYVDVLVR